MKLGLAATKGGTGKTTSAVNLGMALHRSGRTLAVDCDPQGSLLRWSVAAEAAGNPLPFTVISLPTKDVHRRLADLAADYEHVIIDSPPGNEGIIRSVIMASSLVLVPVSPTGLDLDRIRPTFELLADYEPDVGVLLTRVRSGTRSARDARAGLEEFGYPLLDTVIPERELYAQGFGGVPSDIGAYESLLTELYS